MKTRWLGIGLALALAGSAGAWRPVGWVYHNHPWAYDSASGDWYWFNTPDTQWVVRMSNGQWARLPESALATGWGFYSWAFVYSDSQGAWFWINETDQPWVANMRTGEWTRFGVSTVPEEMVSVPSGVRIGWDTIFNLSFSLYLPRPLFVDIHEVPKAHWDAVRAWGGFQGYSDLPAGGGKSQTHPVHSVNWYDCVKWSNARSQRAGMEPVYYTDAAFTQIYKTGMPATVHVKTNAPGFRLPTEEEWEVAARGGMNNGSFPFPTDSAQIYHGLANYYSHTSYAYDISPTRGYHPTYNDGTTPYTAPVGSFAANGYGIYNLAGNVREWCFDKHPNASGTARATRGGSWWDFANSALVMGRMGVNPTNRNTQTGFRLVATRP